MNQGDPYAIMASTKCSQRGNFILQAVYLWVLPIFLISIYGILIISFLAEPYTFSVSLPQVIENLLSLFIVYCSQV